MGYAKYVGRVGALALALGLGTAVATPAWAESPSSNESTATEGKSSQKPPQQRGGTAPDSSAPADRSDTAGPSDSSGPSDADESAGSDNESADVEGELDNIDEPVDEPDEALVEEIDEPTGDRAESSSPDVEAAADAPSVTAEATEPTSLDSEATPPAVAAGNYGDDYEASTVTYAVTGATTPPVVPTPAHLVPQPKTPIGVILGGPVALLDIAAKAISMLFNPAPTLPGDSPILLGVLAFVRREIQRTFFNSSPTAADDTATTTGAVPTRITVLDNDTDPNPGDILTITNYTQAANGVVALNPDGSFTYTPVAGFTGTDTFSYTISDEASAWHVHGLASLLKGHKSIATVTITVTAAPVNESPSATDDSVNTAEDAAVVIDAMANDTDPDGDDISISDVGTPAHGTVAILDGKITYTPESDFHGTDSFTYTVTDGSLTDTATVTVTVTPVNDAPVAVNDTVTVAGNSSDNVIDVRGNDTDPDAADTLTVTVLGEPSHGGTVEINEDMTVSYTPATGFSGTETFTYTVSDGTAVSVGTVTVTVTPVEPVNIPPTATNDTFTMPAGSTSATVNVVANDTDADGDTLSVTAVTGAVNGTTTFTGGSITYTPTAGFAGTEVLTYTVSDGTATTTATLTITVPAVNKSPVATNDTFTMPAGSTSATVNVVANDTDADGDTLSVTAVTGAVNGTTTFTGGSITYTPTAGFAGTEVLTYTVSDGTATTTATLTITVPAVSPENHAPVVGEPAYQYTTHAYSGIISGTVDVTDEDDDALTYTVSGVPDAGMGTLAIDPTTGKWQFKPTNQARFEAWRTAGGREVTFEVTVSDGLSSVTVNVAARISPLTDFERDWSAAEVHDAKSVVVLGSDGRLFLDNSHGLTVMNPDGSLDAPIVLGFRPTDAAFGKDGRLYVTDPLTDSIAVLDLATGVVTQFASASGASGLAFGSDGRLFVTSPDNRTITVIESDGYVANVILLDAIPSDVAVGADGRIYVAEIADDLNSVRLTVRNLDGSVDAVLYDRASTPLGGYAGPLGVAVGVNGDIYFADTNQGTLTVFTAEGQWAGETWAPQLTHAFAVYPDGRITLLSSIPNALSVVTPRADESAWDYDYTVDRETSVVTGAVYTLDPAGNLTFELSIAPPSTLGTVTLDPTTGAWVFTPTAAAVAAVAYGAYDPSFDHENYVGFLITASDGTQIEASAPIFGTADYTVDVIEEVGGAPHAVTIGSDGRIYLLNRESKSITVLNSSGQIAGVIELDFVPAAITNVSSGYGPGSPVYLVVTNGVDNTFTVIDVNNDNTAYNFTLPDHIGPLSAVAGGTQFGVLVVASNESDTVTVVTDFTTPVWSFNAPNPTGVTLSADYDIFVVGTDDDGAGYLRVYDILGNLKRITVLGGKPSGITLGSNGMAYVSNLSGSPRDVAVVDQYGWVHQTVDLDVRGSAIAAGSGGQILVADADAGTLTVLNPPNVPPQTTPVGSVDVINAESVAAVYGIAVTADGRILVTGFDHSGSTALLAEVKADGSTTLLTDLSGAPFGIDVSPEGRIFVADSQTGTVTAYDPANGYASEIVATIPGAVGLAFDGIGNLYVTSVSVETMTGTLTVIHPDGTSSSVTELPGVGYDVHVAPDGRIYVTYITFDAAEQIPASGGVLIVNPDGTSEDLALPSEIVPVGIAVGPNGTVFMTDLRGALVVRYPTGLIRAISAGGQPFGLAFDAEGQLLISDALSHTITVLNPIYSPTNSAPWLEDPHEYSVSSGGIVNGGVIVGNSDGDLLTFSVVAEIDPSVGVVVVNTDTGEWQFTPTEQARLDAWEAWNDPELENHTVTFSITVSDGEFSDSISITVEILPNTEPKADNPAYVILSSDESTGIVTALLNVTDLDGDTLAYHIDTMTGSEGQAQVDSSGYLIFTPSAVSRYRAWLSDVQVEVTVAVTVSDGQHETTVHVVLPVVPHHLDGDGVLDTADLLTLAAIEAIEVNENTDGTIRSIRGPFSGISVQSAADAAEVLNQVSGFLGAPDGFAAGSSVTEERIHSPSGDLLQTVYRMPQRISGIELAGSEVVLAVSPDGIVRGLFSSLRYHDVLDTNATLEIGQAAEIATAMLWEEFGEEVPQEVRDALAPYLNSSGELVLVESGQSAQLAWRITLSIIVPHGTETAVDVPDDAIVIPVVARAYDVAANGDDAGTLIATHSGLQAAALSQQAHGYEFVAEDTGDGILLKNNLLGISTYRAKYTYTISGQFILEELPGDIISKSDGWELRAVAAHANISNTHSFYADMLGRDSIDGVGGEVKISLGIRAEGSGIYDAAWSGPYKQIVINRGPEQYERALDVMAHEFTHGVIMYIVGRGDWKKTLDQGESGALNEAYSDILGSLIEASIKGLSLDDPKRWLIGEDVLLDDGRKALRDLAKPWEYSWSGDLEPIQYRYHYDDLYRGYRDEGGEPKPIDQGGEHINSTIFSHAAYKMIVAEPSVSTEDWAVIFYQSLKLLPGGKSFFIDAREAVLIAAENHGLTRSQLNSVKKAFDDVGISPSQHFYVPFAELPAAGTVLPGVGDAHFMSHGSRIIAASHNDSGSTVLVLNAETGVRLSTSYFDAALGTRLTIAPNDTHAVFTGSSIGGNSLVAILDTRNGNQVGAPVSIAGEIRDVTFEASESSAIISFIARDPETQVRTVRVVAVSLETGALQGAGIMANSTEDITFHIDPNGRHVSVLTSTGAISGTEINSYSLTVLDIVEGTPIGSKIDFVASDVDTSLNADGSRLVLLIDTQHEGSMGQGSINIVLIDTQNGLVVGHPVSVEGSVSSTHWIESPRGGTAGRIIVTSRTTDGSLHVAVIDSATGIQVGETAHLPESSFLEVQVTHDGAYAALVHKSSFQYSSQGTTSATIFELSTGSITGSVELIGQEFFGLKLNSASTRATLMVGHFAGFGSKWTSVASIDLATGTLVGDILSVGGQLGSATGSFESSGDRMLVSASGDVTRTAVFDASTGNQIGSVTELLGYKLAAKAAANGTRAVVAHHVDAAEEAARISVIDMNTGTVIGDRLVLEGAFDAMQITPDNQMALAVTVQRSQDWLWDIESTHMAIVDLTTGVQTGDTLKILGRPYGSSYSSLDNNVVEFNDVGTVAVVATYYHQAYVFKMETTTLVTIIDMTMTNSARTFAVRGELREPPQINSQGTLAVVTTQSKDSAGQEQTQVVVFDLRTRQPLKFVYPWA